MSGGDCMPKIESRKLKQADLDFMKLVEQRNLERVQKLQKVRKNNILSGCLLGVGVLSVYAYSMYAVKQETFLDDFEEPAKIFELPTKSIEQQ